MGAGVTVAYEIRRASWVRDVTLHQQYMADVAESSKTAIDTVDPTPYFVKYGDNTHERYRRRAAAGLGRRGTQLRTSFLLCSPNGC